MCQEGHVMGSNYCWKIHCGPVSQPVRGIGSVHCSGSAFHCYLRIPIVQWETQTWTMDNLLLDRVCMRGSVSYPAAPGYDVHWPWWPGDGQWPGWHSTLQLTANLHTAPAAHIIIILAMGKEVLARDSINFLSRSVYTNRNILSKDDKIMITLPLYSRHLQHYRCFPSQINIWGRYNDRGWPRGQCYKYQQTGFIIEFILSSFIKLHKTIACEQNLSRRSTILSCPVWSIKAFVCVHFITVELESLDTAIYFLPEFNIQ